MARGTASTRPAWLVAITLGLTAVCGVEASAAQGAPTTAQPAADPVGFTIRGETRVRYETLEGQFRAGGSGGDQALAFRTLLLAEVNRGPIAAGLEFQDSRSYLDDAGTPLSTSIVNPLDVLQAYVRVDLDNVPGQKTASLKLGRQTLDIGSRRVIERVEMANVIFAYTGAYWRSVNAGGDELHLVYVSPVGRLPADRASLGENLLSGDEEEWGRRFWGIHYRKANLLGTAVPGVWAEAFLYGLDERDEADVPTPNRHYLQPGVRLFRAPGVGRLDGDLEAAYRFGTRRQTAAPTDTRDLDVSASMLHAHIGYTFDRPWRPRVSVDYDYAGGDRNPTDGEYGQFERLFGSRRTDLGNTGIFGPLTPANLSAPGVRIEASPSQRLDFRLAYKAAFLAQGRDAWVVARVQDSTGQSGRFIGHTLDSRLRFWLSPDRLRLEVGASALIPGGFAREAPNASGEGTTLFGYAQITRTF